MKDRLATVARLRELELEHARVDHAAATASLSRHEKLLADIRARLDESHAFAQQLVESSDGVSAAALGHVRAYSQWQAKRFEQQRVHVDEAEGLVGETQTELSHRFQALAAIDSLRERRARDVSVELARAGQKTLDEHALVREAHRSKKE